MVNNLKGIDSFVDVSCGTGELPVQAVKHGFLGKIYIFDSSNLNIKITKIRLKKLGFNNLQTFLYTNKVTDTAKEFKEIMKMNKIQPDLIIQRTKPSASAIF